MPNNVIVNYFIITDRDISVKRLMSDNYIPYRLLLLERSELHLSLLSN